MIPSIQAVAEGSSMEEVGVAEATPVVVALVVVMTRGTAAFPFFSLSDGNKGRPEKPQTAGA